MLIHVIVALKSIDSLLKTRQQLAAENLVPRQQIAMLLQSGKRPRVSFADRLFWVLFSRTSNLWRSMLHVSHPDTVARWHRRAFRIYWSWKSRSKQHQTFEYLGCRHGTALTLAKRIRGTRHWLDPSRVFKPRYRPQVGLHHRNMRIAA